MKQGGLIKFYWGFLFLMFNFRFNGFDILPDIVGYLLFAAGFINLASKSEYFEKAIKYDIPMIILSIFSIYQVPAQGVGVSLIQPWMILIGIASFILNLLVVYNLFMGIKDMADVQHEFELISEADKRWEQYIAYEIASIFLLFLIIMPLLAMFYVIILLVIGIAIMTKIMKFIRICDENMSTLEE